MHGVRVVAGVVSLDVVVLRVDPARCAISRCVVAEQFDLFERPARCLAAHLHLGHGAQQVDGSQMGEHPRCERHLLAAFYAVHRNQPFAGQCERCGERVTAAFRRAKLLDRRLSRRHFSGVGGPVRQCDDLEICGRHLVRFPDHFIRFRPVGIVSVGDKLHGLERGEVSVLRIEKEESVIPVFEVDLVLEFALRAVVVRAFRRSARPRAVRAAERDAEAYPHVVRPLRAGSGDRLFMSGPAARHERRAGERRETDENAYDSVR